MRSHQWTIPVIVLSGKVTVSEAIEALKETVVDIISKPPSVPRLMSAVEISLTGPNSASRQNVAILRAHLQSLNSTERSVLSMLLSGSSNKVISSRLDLGLRSAVRYRKTILDTFGFSTVPELANALGAAGIRVTELAAPPVFTPGIPQQHRVEIRNQLRLLKSTLAKVDLTCPESLQQAIHKAQVELERITNHSHLATPDSTPVVVVLSEDPQLGGLLRDLFRAHGLHAEACLSSAEASALHLGQAASPTNYLVAVESAVITTDQLRSLRSTYGADTRVALVSADQHVGDDTDSDFVRFSLLNGPSLIEFVLNDLAKKRAAEH
jgi:DNA-binding response OmpR family regulator